MSSGDPLVDVMLRGHLLHGNFAPIDRPPHAATTAALQAAEQLAGRSHRVMWLDDPSPTMTSVPIPKDPHGGVAVAGSRMIEMIGALRSILLSGLPETGAKAEMSSWLFELIAEHAAHTRMPGLAVKALAKSIGTRGPDDWRPEPPANTTTGPYVQAALAVWGFAILHEIGHLEFDPAQIASANDRAVLDLLNWLEHNALTSSVAEAVDVAEKAVTERDKSVIGLDVLQVEFAADAFATQALLHATLDAQRAAGQEFDPGAFVAEADAALTSATVVYRLKHATALSAMAARNDNVDEQAAAGRELAVQSLATMARTFKQKQVIAKRMLTDPARPGDLDEKDVVKLTWALAGEMRPREQAYQGADRAMTDAAWFVLFDASRLDESDAVASLAAALDRTDAFDADVRRVVTVAESADCATPAIAELGRLLAAPGR